MTAQPDIWRGFHHVALATPHFDDTLRFYGTVLGMDIGEIRGGADGHGRHAFIKPGADSTWGIHLFEHADAELFARPELLTERYGFVRGALQHIAFRVADEAAATNLRAHLTAHGVPITPVNTLGGVVRNFLFTDNNGLILEAAWDV